MMAKNFVGEEMKKKHDTFMDTMNKNNQIIIKKIRIQCHYHKKNQSHKGKLLKKKKKTSEENKKILIYLLLIYKLMILDFWIIYILIICQI